MLMNNTTTGASILYDVYIHMNRICALIKAMYSDLLTTLVIIIIIIIIKLQLYSLPPLLLYHTINRWLHSI